MVTVLTVLKSGGVYTPAHVKNIQAMVSVYLPGASFKCLSDVEIPGVDVIPLKHNWPGWWSKMELFSLDGGPFFYLDLDTVILGNLSDIVNSAKGHDFVILRDFYRGLRHPAAMGSGLMYWEKSLKFLYDAFKKNPTDVRGGDQAFLELMLLRGVPPVKISYFQDLTPEVVSFKAHVRPRAKILPTDKIICFHGNPRPWEQSFVPYPLILDLKLLRPSNPPTSIPRADADGSS